MRPCRSHGIEALGRRSALSYALKRTGLFSCAPGARLRLGATILLAFAVCAAEATTPTLISRQEALALAYPGAHFQAERLFLTAEQQKRVAEIAGGDPPNALIARYVATKEGNIVGRAYLDTHVVRTKKESLLISLDDSGHVKRVDVTAFLEPSEYQAPDGWLNQYHGKSLSDDLALQRAIRPIAGATLTAMATNQAVRRALAIDRLLQGGSQPKGK